MTRSWHSQRRSQRALVARLRSPEPLQLKTASWYPWINIFPFPPPPKPLAAIHLFSVSASFCEVPHISDSIQNLSSLTYLTEHNALEVHPCCCRKDRNHYLRDVSAPRCSLRRYSQWSRHGNNLSVHSG